jgi:hypothetical protein
MPNGLTWRLFDPCTTGRHVECAAELVPYQCSCHCHHPSAETTGKAHRLQENFPTKERGWQDVT